MPVSAENGSTTYNTPLSVHKYPLLYPAFCQSLFNNKYPFFTFVHIKNIPRTDKKVTIYGKYALARPLEDVGT